MSAQTAEVAPSPTQIAKSTNGAKPVKAKRTARAPGASRGRPKSAASTIPTPSVAEAPAPAPAALAPMPKKGGGKKTMPLAAAAAPSPDSLSPTMKRLVGKYPKKADKTAGLSWLHDAAALMMETCGFTEKLTITFG